LFTGIVEELGEVVSLEPLPDAARLYLRAPTVAGDLGRGDSIAVDGVCLTVADITPAGFTVDVMGETLRRSTLGSVTQGARVNLERAARVDGRLGGHVVQGHVDGTGAVVARRRLPHWDDVRISVPPSLARYVVEKGSIAVDGISLTVAAVDDSSCSVGLIPTTLERTTLGRKRVGEPVNLEVDVLAKYVERLLEARGTRS
jgi:riboflavin synthase